jgi:hypothetical protein
LEEKQMKSENTSKSRMFLGAGILILIGGCLMLLFSEPGDHLYAIGVFLFGAYVINRGWKPSVKFAFATGGIILALGVFQLIRCWWQIPFQSTYGSLTLKRNFENGLPRREPMKCGL